MRTTLRKAICERAGDCCEYCLMQTILSHDPFSAEHILPISKGRATITCLKLNRIGLVNLRKILAAAGKHPPIL